MSIYIAHNVKLICNGLCVDNKPKISR